ncbi:MULTISPECIES: (2Fe-2S)-binding protein [Amycolatopsis]|uniref:Carbon-monoxide dehydrogenase small subunit/6-hydroxypseudooxynicotine dehydrogenase subunit beta n=1 Tax=Amycolatopsis echigonensis TaxID=2576905 RepID=A0A2N3WNQ5_9PSEU|nr:MULTISPECIES: (2Fe-2S)-binding protein [Amycolatopsis]PKV95492.1 carbon-monoxide dehydrogenase small subunit/6-hydroxypseudooxynicotine dehydrogenase subunit beta [Amycolatopsis niigatensis]
MNGYDVTVVVNGQTYEKRVEPRRLLSDFLRHDLHLRGTRVGCEHGVCGSCTVLLDGEPVRSCTTLAVQTDGCEVQTVESLAESSGSDMHPLQEAFSECHALQCGFCTSGFLMTLKPVYDSGASLSREQVRETISGNLCRCTGYQQIVEATELALQRRDEDS